LAFRTAKAFLQPSFNSINIAIIKGKNTDIVYY